jgi:hypothetical protein
MSGGEESDFVRLFGLQMDLHSKIALSLGQKLFL